MPGVDPRPSMPRVQERTMRRMETILVLILIVALGLVAQVAGADTRGFDSRPSH